MYRLYLMDRMAFNPRQASMRIRISDPREARMVSLTRVRRLIRCQGWGLGRPNPNDRQIILTRITIPRRLSRANRLRRQTRQTILTSITSLDGETILNRTAVIDRRTRLTRMPSMARRH